MYQIIKTRPIAPEAFMRWAVDVACLARKTDSLIAGRDGFGEPVITPDLVEFNGCGESFQDHTPFRFGLNDPIGVAVVSTGLFRPRPYDTLVQAAMIAMRCHFPESVAISTTVPPDGWDEGISLAREVLGESATVFTL